MICLRRLSKTYPGGSPALDTIDLEIGPGEFVVLVGPSGAGKSTLLRCVNGLVTPSAGEVVVDGERLVDASPQRLRAIRARVGFVFQQFNLLRRLSVLENVLVGRLPHVPAWRGLLGWFGRAEVSLARAALDRVGLAGLGDRRADRLSGGQQQRVAIARALVQRPRILLADEPMASLDPALARTVMDLLQRINREDGITVVTSLHVLELARAYGRRVVGLRAGTVVFDGSPRDLTPALAEGIFGGHDR